MKYLALLLLLIPLSLFGQVESQFNGTLNVFSASRIGFTNTFTISGIFSSTTSSYTSANSAIGDIVQVQSGSRFYWLHIYSIASNSGGVITGNVRDSSSTLTTFPTGKWSIFRPTPNLRLPLSPDGESNASRSATFNTLALRVDEIQSSVASATNCEQTITKTAHGFRKWTPIFWNGSTYIRPTNDSIVPDYIVVDSLTANTFKVASCGTYSTVLANGLYWYTNNSPGYSLTPDTTKVPLFQVIDSVLILDPIIGFNLMSGSASGDVTSAVLADTAAAIRADFPTGVSDGDKGDITVLGGTWTIDNNAITTGKILDGTILNADLASQTLDSNKVKNRAITTVKLADDAVTSAKIGTGQVGADELASSGVTAGTYGSSSAVPVVTVDQDGRIIGMSTVGVSGGGVTLTPDTFGLPEIKEFVPAVGISANESVTNYTPSSLDQNRYKLSTTRFGLSGSTEYGGWLGNGTSGDSVSITAPFGVVIGDSQAEGHPGLHGRLHPRTNTFQSTYRDSVGQLSYRLRQLTKMRWYNQGIGGETSRQTRYRFYRDAIGVNSNPNDGRGSVTTIPGKPYIVTIVTGINDVFAGYTTDEVIENLRWMAATCNENGIKCVVLNLPGDEIITQAQARNIEVVNKFLNEGGLDPYNAVVVDYNKWWKDPSYNSLNVGNSLIADDIHPSKVGYDSLANYIFREANLPILSKLVISTERDPSGFSGFSRPNSVNLNGTTYAIASSDIDTLELTNVLKDTVWIKINSSTNVTGTTYSGFSHLQWYLTNNPQNRQYYTKRRYYGAPVQRLSSTSLILKPTGFEAQDIIDVRYADNNPAFRVNVSGGLQVNMGNGSTFTASEMVRVHGAFGVAAYLRGYQDARIGNFEISRSGFASGTGSGVVSSIEGLRFDFGAGHLEFRNWQGNSGTTAWNSSNIAGHVTWRSGFSGSLNANGRTAVYHNEIPIYNMTFGGGVTAARVWYRYYNPTITSLPAGIQHIYLENVSGDNLFNTTSGNTSIGNTNPLAKLHVTGDCIVTSTLWLNAAKTVGTFTGTGSPESVVTASVGSVFHRTDGGAGTSFYVKESGTGNTGWVAK